MPKKPVNIDKRWIPAHVRRRLVAMPCAVCGLPWSIHVDHITPMAKGGKTVEENLQALCPDCNYVKKELRTNEQTAVVIGARGLVHFMLGVYRHDTLGQNPYDCPPMTRWFEIYPASLDQAKQFFQAFLAKVTHA